MSLHLNTQRQQAVNQFEVSVRSALPSLMQALPWADDAADPAGAGGLLAYQDDGTAPAAQHPEIALRPQDVVSAQLAATSNPLELTEVVDNNFWAADFSFWVSPIRREGLPADGFKPMLPHRMITIGFRASDQPLIERYANQQHLSQADAQWQYFDPTLVESLAGQRRVVTEAIGDESPNRTPEVAPGGGKYWADDPNAAWW